MPVIIPLAAAALQEVHRTFRTDFAQQFLAGLEFEGNTDTSSSSRPSAITSLATNVPVLQTYTRGGVALSSVLQPFQAPFTPNVNVTLSEQSTDLERGKVDLLFTSDDLDKLKNRWTIEWAKWTNLDPRTWSFPRFIWEQAIIPKLISEINDAAWNGVRTTPVNGVAGSPLQAFTGYKKRIADAVTAGLVVEIPTGAITAANILDKVEVFFKTLPALVRNRPGRLIMSASNASNYYLNWSDRFGMGGGNVGNENNNFSVRARAARIIGVTAMEGSNRFIFVPDQTPGMIYGTMIGESQPLPDIRWEPFERQLKGMAEIHRFYDMEYHMFTYVNDQV